jgi:hypothetical protein
MMIALLMSGCAAAVFDERACPREKQYTKAQQTALADDLAKAGPALKGAMVDYLKLRDKARACRGE